MTSVVWSDDQRVYDISPASCLGSAPQLPRPDLAEAVAKEVTARPELVVLSAVILEAAAAAAAAAPLLLVRVLARKVVLPPLGRVPK
eukprot:scaffold56902_cov25-Prasinocladus_malaysianus.AAC.1